MSVIIVAFNTIDASVTPGPVNNLSGTVLRGYRVVNVSSIGGVSPGDYTSAFEPIISVDGQIQQEDSNLNGGTMIALVERP